MKSISALLIADSSYTGASAAKAHRLKIAERRKAEMDFMARKAGFAERGDYSRTFGLDSRLRGNDNVASALYLCQSGKVML